MQFVAWGTCSLALFVMSSLGGLQFGKRGSPSKLPLREFKLRTVLRFGQAASAERSPAMFWGRLLFADLRASPAVLSFSDFPLRLAQNSNRSSKSEMHCLTARVWINKSKPEVALTCMPSSLRSRHRGRYEQVRGPA